MLKSRLEKHIAVTENKRCRKTSAVCAVWVFSHAAQMSAYSGPSITGTPTLLEAVVELFFPMPRLIPLRTRPLAITLRRRRRIWGVLAVFAARGFLLQSSVVQVL